MVGMGQKEKPFRQLFVELMEGLDPILKMLFGNVLSSRDLLEIRSLSGEAQMKIESGLSQFSGEAIGQFFH